MEADMEWQLADAKNRFSELMNQALRAGPQRVRRRNEAVIVISADDYERLKGQTISFRQYLLTGESLDGVDLSRDRSLMREAAL
jgi:prevent-host-death family protein